ncbi:single-stranded-DNA-specific exonuclease RecJ [Fulvivirga sp. M361]|uniref:single-stranded-DNA-specific exonuclease RecJ n=1 Tax=Fulvivirga sp. M361 TaxID=2594266 RepID=UPI00117A0F4C|nr:single-stranded-DNA-specific exonuclease RecJ [Fulvivirga sp. M361]TRX62796.1 single-stranded-DNA-specific exonuclease RecJ [Fulvivirga sp. M361]
MIEKRWAFEPTPDPELISQLSKAINTSAPLATILCQRNITTFNEAKTFFNPSLDQLHDPFLMKDMDRAVHRIWDAIEKQEKVLIYGDYDVDGTTSVALFFGFLNSFYTSCDFYIPDRYSEGYGISQQGIDWAYENNVALIIALDCGIKSVELTTYAKDKGIDLIICDHHRPGDILPPAVAILDPKREDCSYPFKELSGCGIGFKLMQALLDQKPELDIDPLDFLDLVAVSIASDIVPVSGENRVLAYYGLKRLNAEPRPGLKALMDLAGIHRGITVTGIVFGLAPRINAAGRISHAKMAVNLLLADSIEEAGQLASKLNIKNNTRKDFDAGITQEALAMIEQNDELRLSKSTVLYKEDWHKGVIGIVASRCIEKYHRPTIILTASNNKATGSARSVPGFDVYNAISSCSEVLEQYGGHKYAAGLTLEIDKIAEFQQRFEEEVSRTITDEQLIPRIDIDCTLDPDHITDKFLKVLERMAPFGPENLRPVFASTNCEIVGSVRILKEEHLKFTVKRKGGVKKWEAIAFKQATRYDLLCSGKPFRLAYTVEENEYKGLKSIQLNVKDLRFDQ